jgi:hypothetical protein
MEKGAFEGKTRLQELRIVLIVPWLLRNHIIYLLLSVSLRINATIFKTGNFLVYVCRS